MMRTKAIPQGNSLGERVPSRLLPVVVTSSFCGGGPGRQMLAAELKAHDKKVNSGEISPPIKKEPPLLGPQPQ